MKITELQKILKLNRTTINNYARQGKFKTAHKVKENHIEIWVVDDEEAQQFINSKQR